jgi:DNA-binding NarL/FixJ family response regulator
MQAKIFLIESHDFIRYGLRALLKNHFLITGETSNGIEAIIKLEEMEKEALPDLILMDMDMVEMNGADCARAIKEKHPDIKILMLTADEDINHLNTMIHSGAEGYIMKNSSTDELLFATKRVMNDEIFICTELSLNILNYLKSESKIKMDGDGKSDGKFNHDGEGKSDGQHKLLSYEITEREMDVLKLIGEGLTNSEIAEKLFTSVRTIETRRRNLLEKTKTKNTAMLIKYAVKNGLLQ